MRTHWNALLGAVGCVCALGASMAQAMSLEEFVVTSAEKRYALFRQLHGELESSGSAAKLEKEIPRISASLRVAARVSSAHWSDSTPFDEKAKAYVLSEKVMTALGLKPEKDGEVVHVSAGLIHSYGYLFSQLQTAFGLKGKRWLESRLDERLGLPPGAFSPFVTEGEFLSNLTYTLDRIVGEKPSVLVAKHASTVLKKKADALAKSGELKPTGVLSEQITWRDAAGKEQRGLVQTHLVSLRSIAGFETKDSSLLLYSVDFGKGRKWVTAFPIEEGFAQSIRTTPTGESAQFTPRFNLYVPSGLKTVSRVVKASF